MKKSFTVKMLQQIDGLFLLGRVQNLQVYQNVLVVNNLNLAISKNNAGYYIPTVVLMV